MSPLDIGTVLHLGGQVHIASYADGPSAVEAGEHGGGSRRMDLTSPSFLTSEDQRGGRGC